MPQSFSYPLLFPPVTKKPGVSPQRDSGTRSLTYPVTFGRGVLAPFRRDGKGDFANADDIELVRSNVREVLGTYASSGSTLGELQWRPEFGSLLQLLRYRNLDQTTEELARVYVIEALRTWITSIRVTDSNVVSNYSAGTLSITITYTILGNRNTALATNQTQTIEVPVGE